jgi:plastocyanin
MWSSPRLLVLVPLALGLAACGDDSSSAGTSTTDGAAATAITCTADAGGSSGVEIKDFTFSPADAEIKAGQSVTWTNGDDFAHSVHGEKSTDGTPAWQSVGPDAKASLPEALPAKATSTCTFPKAGTYSYICGIHNTMRGTVTVK